MTPASRLDIHMSALEDAGFSGTVLVAREGEIVLHKGYGLADRRREIACRPDTIFDLGSVTKQFTATAILKLEMAGKLRTDDTLTKHFEGIPRDKAGITLHQLLTHTSGLDHAYGKDENYAPRDVALQVFFKMPLLFTPGREVPLLEPRLQHPGRHRGGRLGPAVRALPQKGALRAGGDDRDGLHASELGHAAHDAELQRGRRTTASRSTATGAPTARTITASATAAS